MSPLLHCIAQAYLTKAMALTADTLSAAASTHAQPSFRGAGAAPIGQVATLAGPVAGAQPMAGGAPVRTL